MSAPRSRFSHSSPRIRFLEWNPDASRTVILLHGNSANAWWWQWVAEELPKDLRLLALDQRGHGDSEWVKPPAYKPHDYAGDVANFIREETRDRHPIVVGHSMGGVVTLAFASRYAELARGVIVIDTAVVSSRGRDRFLHRLKALPTVVYPDLETAKARFRLMPNEGEIPEDRVLAIAEKSLMPAESSGYTLKFDRESFFGGDGLQVMDTIRALHNSYAAGARGKEPHHEPGIIGGRGGLESACATDGDCGRTSSCDPRKPPEVARVIAEFVASQT